MVWPTGADLLALWATPPMRVGWLRGAGAGRSAAGRAEDVAGAGGEGDRAGGRHDGAAQEHAGPAGAPNGPPVNVHTTSASAPTVNTAAAASGKNPLGSTGTGARRRQYAAASR